MTSVSAGPWELFHLPRVTPLRKVSKIVLLLIGKTRGTIIKLVKATVSFSPKNIPHALFVVTAVCNNLYVGEASRTFSAIQQASVIFIDWLADRVYAQVLPVASFLKGECHIAESFPFNHFLLLFRGA